MNTEQKVFDAIQKKQVHMYSRYWFDALDYGKCFLAFVLVFCAALVFGVALSLVMHFFAEISWSNFPYILVGASLSLIALAYATFISSFSFYRVQFATGIVAGLILVMCIGGFLFGSGHAERWEKKFQKNTLYRSTLPARMIHEDHDRDDS